MPHTDIKRLTKSLIKLFVSLIFIEIADKSIFHIIAIAVKSISYYNANFKNVSIILIPIIYNRISF